MNEILRENRYTVREAARIIPVGETTLRRYIELGLIQSYRVGKNGKMLISESELIRFLETNLISSE